ncbi:sulfotransferase 1C2-like [Anolis sagrei]|uniref:sulfotransferase 1C2-like n=1 Tax=Anolis sagrei TaxID=38937 RepID=UPI00351FD511
MDFQPEMESLDPNSTKDSLLVDFDGIPYCKETVKYWEEIQNFKARPDDVLICTYPKAGTTWMQEIVDMIQHGGDSEKCARGPIYQRCPFIELSFLHSIPTSIENIEAMPSPRTFKTHFPVQHLPPSFWEQNCKIIYVARNAKDNMASSFHFHNMTSLLPDSGSWDEFMENFIAGKVCWGSWSDHVQGWWKAKDCHPILYLFYEDIKEDPACEIQKIAQFLGIDLSASVLNQIVQHTKFENMKTNPLVNHSTLPSLFDLNVSPFMRKGIVGDWKEHFTVAQSERLDNICAWLFASSGLSFRTVISTCLDLSPSCQLT